MKNKKKTKTQQDIIDIIVGRFFTVVLSTDYVISTWEWINLVKGDKH